MIQFNTLKISQNGKNLIISASVKNLKYYSDVFIGSIIIDNQDTYSANGPSSNPIYKRSFAGTNIVTGEEIKGVKEINLKITAKEIKDNEGNLNNDILYIYLIAAGTPTSDTPCGMDEVNTLGVAYNIRPIYNIGMSYIKQVANTCKPSKEFIDFILKYKALELCLETNNYIQANKFWNKYFKKITNLNIKNCGCT